MTPSSPTLQPSTLQPSTPRPTTASNGVPQLSPPAPLERLGVLPWQGLPDGAGHDPRSAYVETFWLPIVGPSTTLLLRRLADELDACPDGFEIDCASTSRDLGLGPRTDAKGAFARTLDRCAKFKMVRLDGPILHVRRLVPTLGTRHVAKLSDRLRLLHASWTIDPTQDGSNRRLELMRAAHLARTLLALDETPHDIEDQLHRWQFHPSIAWHAVQLAQTDPELDF